MLSLTKPRELARQMKLATVFSSFVLTCLIHDLLMLSLTKSRELARQLKLAWQWQLSVLQRNEYVYIT
jgi:hypothetical protein